MDLAYCPERVILKSNFPLLMRHYENQRNFECIKEILHSPNCVSPVALYCVYDLLYLFRCNTEDMII